MCAAKLPGHSDPFSPGTASVGSRIAKTNRQVATTVCLVQAPWSTLEICRVRTVAYLQATGKKLMPVVC